MPKHSRHVFAYHFYVNILFRMQVRKSGVMQHKINKFIMLTDKMMMFNVHYNLGQLFLPASMTEYLKIEITAPQTCSI